MQDEPLKNRKERLAELLTKNKVRLARNAAREWYLQGLGYHLTFEDFLEFDISQHILSDVYRKVRTLEKKSLVFADLQEMRTTLNELKQQQRNMHEANAIFYYLYALQVGGIKIKLKEFWEILEKIGNNPATDIIVTDELLTFGICIEVEEYDYVLTVWGFGE